MHPRRPYTVLSLVAVVLLGGLLLAGCGGGGEQSGGGSQNGGGSEEKQGGEATEEKQGGEAAGEDGPEAKIALGTVTSVEPDKRIISLRAVRGEQEAERMVFKVRKNARVTLEGAKTDLADVQEGQQAQIEYIAKDKLDRATTVKLFATDGQPAGGGEGTG